MQWPNIGSEELTWHYDPDELRGLSRTARRRITPTYRASVPLMIAQRSLSMPQDLLVRIADLSAAIARFDRAQAARGYDLPALLLRSESSASSQIENLTSSVRNVALAELTDSIPKNAQLIAGNVAAMKAALKHNGALTLDAILNMQAILVNRAGQTFGGALREEQVWIGGSSFSPHGAQYVPPSFERLPSYMDDLLAFSRRDDMNPIIKGAVFHAQFETVHPFIDGNGRTGRALLHVILRRDGLLGESTLPVSAGLLHNIDRYMEALTQYQEGDPTAVVEQLVDALELACVIGERLAARIDSVIASWNSSFKERAGSSIYALPAILVEQPVVNRSYLVEKLGISERACSNLIDRAEDYGILRPVGSGKRAAFYQAEDLLEILDETSSISSIRRMLVGNGS